VEKAPEELPDPGDLRKVLSYNIRAARKARDFTQAELARRAGVSLPYVVDIEHCKTWVSDKTLLGLAGAFQVSPYELLLPPGESPGVSALLPALRQDILRRLEAAISSALAEYQPALAVSA